MKRFSVAILLSGVIFLGACTLPTDSIDEPATMVPYLGQPLPGPRAVVFAPGLVSVEGRYEYGVSLPPGGRELLFTGQEPDGPSVLIHFSATEGGWDGPREVRLSGGQKAEEMEAFYTPDGRRIYFAAYDEGLDVRIWVVDRDQNGWRSPRQLGSPMADDPSFFPTATADGTVYYSNLAKRRIYRAKVRDDSMEQTEDTGLEAMHAYVAPDESFVLVDLREGGENEDSDIFVSFRLPNGSWSGLADLGPEVNTEYDETCPSLSPEGQFLFFSRYNEPNNISNVYWVSSTHIQAAREKLGVGL